MYTYYQQKEWAVRSYLQMHHQYHIPELTIICSRTWWKVKIIESHIMSDGWLWWREAWHNEGLTLQYFLCRWGLQWAWCELTPKIPMLSCVIKAPPTVLIVGLDSMIDMNPAKIVSLNESVVRIRLQCAQEFLGWMFTFSLNLHSTNCTT